MSKWRFTGKNSSFLFSSHEFLPWVTFHNVCDMLWTTYFAAFKFLPFLTCNVYYVWKRTCSIWSSGRDFFIYIFIVSILGISPKQVLDMPLEGEKIQSCWGGRWFNGGMYMVWDYQDVTLCTMGWTISILQQAFVVCLWCRRHCARCYVRGHEEYMALWPGFSTWLRRATP